MFKYHRVKFTKVGENKNMISLEDEYTHNCSEEKYQVVNDEVISAMQEYDQSVLRQKQADYNFCAPCFFDDSVLTQNNINEISIEEQYSFNIEEENEERIQELKFIRSIFNELTDLQRDRIYMHIVYKIKLSSIAEYEGVSPATVSVSYNNGLKKLRRYRDFLLKMKALEWAGLLKSPKLKKYSKKFFK